MLINVAFLWAIFILFFIFCTVVASIGCKFALSNCDTCSVSAHVIAGWTASSPTYCSVCKVAVFKSNSLLALCASKTV